MRGFAVRRRTGRFPNVSRIPASWETAACWPFTPPMRNAQAIGPPEPAGAPPAPPRSAGPTPTGAREQIGQPDRPPGREARGPRSTCGSGFTEDLNRPTRHAV
ncbi:hypothetical protein GCM10010430_22430 [Kitasatospora cystarginea]|uniref:Uncharacterized protein n=1 Tax=Kitasatospora cystarginea TaxID=58350 RepID=A0ABP5QN59_9ACTN